MKSRSQPSQSAHQINDRLRSLSMPANRVHNPQITIGPSQVIESVSQPEPNALLSGRRRNQRSVSPQGGTESVFMFEFTAN